MNSDQIQLYEDQPIRTAWDEERLFSVVDVVGVLTDSVDPAASAGDEDPGKE